MYQEKIMFKNKSQPEKLNYASAGTGTTTQLAMEMLKMAAGIAPQ